MMSHDEKNVVIIRDLKGDDVGIATQRLKFDSALCTSLFVEDDVFSVL